MTVSIEGCKMREKALSGYRRLLRVGKNLFRGDNFALNAYQKELRGNFELNKYENDVEKLEKLWNDIDEAEDFLKNNFVQARLNERGNFETQLPPGTSVSPITPQSLQENKTN